MLRTLEFSEIAEMTVPALLKVNMLCLQAESMCVDMLNTPGYCGLTIDQIIDRQGNALYTRKRAFSELQRRLKF